MKTVISVPKDIQVSMEEYAVVWTSKTFDDNSTISDIKDWLVKQYGSMSDKNKIGLAGVKISNLEE